MYPFLVLVRESWSPSVLSRSPERQTEMPRLGRHTVAGPFAAVRSFLRGTIAKACPRELPLFGDDIEQEGADLLQKLMGDRLIRAQPRGAIVGCVWLWLPPGRPVIGRRATGRLVNEGRPVVLRESSVDQIRVLTLLSTSHCRALSWVEENT